MKTDSEQLQEIYDKNLKIETFHELKENPPLTGHIAKKLINNCKNALKIISKYDTELCESELKKGIELMEDELADENRIRTITYNLDVRNFIHIAIEWVKRWDLK